MKKTSAMIASALFVLMVVTPSVVFAGQNNQTDTTPKQDIKQTGTSTKMLPRRLETLPRKKSRRWLIDLYKQNDTGHGQDLQIRQNPSSHTTEDRAIGNPLCRPM